MEKELYHKKWNQNTVVGAKVIILLKLLEILERKGQNISHSLVVIGVNNRKIYRRITQEIKKAGVFAQDAGAKIL